MYLLLLILFTNEKWINLSLAFMLDLLIKARYIRKFRRQRKEVDGKGGRIREIVGGGCQKGGGGGKTGKSSQPT